MRQPDNGNLPRIDTFAVRRRIAFLTIADIANSFVVSLLPIALAIAGEYLHDNGLWTLHFAVLALWAILAIAWGVLLLATTFWIPRVSLPLDDPHGPDVRTPVRCAVVIILHCMAQYGIFRWFYT